MAAGAICPSTGDLATIKDLLRGTSVLLRQRLTGTPRFDDNADGSISDNETELMWAKKIELDGSANYANLHDADHGYLWANVCSVNTSKLSQPTAAAAAACAAAVEGDAAGWSQRTGGDGTCTSFAGTTVFEWIDALNTAPRALPVTATGACRSVGAGIDSRRREDVDSSDERRLRWCSCGTGCANPALPACAVVRRATCARPRHSHRTSRTRGGSCSGDLTAVAKAFTYFARAVRAGP